MPLTTNARNARVLIQWVIRTSRLWSGGAVVLVERSGAAASWSTWVRSRPR